MLEEEEDLPQWDPDVTLQFGFFASGVGNIYVLGGIIRGWNVLDAV